MSSPGGSRGDDMLRASVVALLLLTTPATADDEWLKQLFNGDGVAAARAETSETAGDGYEDTTPNDPDVDRYIAGFPEPGTGDYDEYVQWYLDGIEGAYRPDGLTDSEYVEWVEEGCPGEDDADKCGMTATQRERLKG
jgi:hypothetical protein